MAEEKEEALPKYVFFFEHEGMTREELEIEESETCACKVCGKAYHYVENSICLLCPYRTFVCERHQVPIHETIDEDSSLYGMCKQHSAHFDALVKGVSAKRGPFPARSDDYLTDWGRRCADLEWQDELRRDILRFRIKAYGRPAPRRIKADKSKPEAKRKRATPAQ